MTASRTRRKGLREALAAKKVHTEHYLIPMEESDIVDPLTERLQQLRQVAFRASLGDDQKVKDDADQKVKEAEAAVDACFWRVNFQGLRSDADFDALVNAHPATEAQIAEAKADFSYEEGDDLPTMDLDGFHLALLVASLVDGDGMTVDEWREELWSERWTRKDRKALFAVVDLANRRDYSGLLPNG